MVETEHDHPSCQCAVLGPPAGPIARSAFAVTFTPPRPGATFRWIQLLVSASPDGGGHPFCFLHLDIPARELWLYGDEGAFVGPVPMGSTSSLLQNSFCAVNPASTQAAYLGPALTFKTNIVFKHACPVPLRLYLRCEMDDAETTGWMHKAGLFTIRPWSGGEPLVEPNKGSGTRQLFSLTFQDPAEPLGILSGWSQFLIATSPEPNGEPFTFLHFDHAGGKLWMYSSEEGFFMGPATPGEPDAVLESNTCRVEVGEIKETRRDGRLAIDIPLAFKETMTGSRNLYLRTLDALGRDSGWLERGQWVIP
ncbi:hypothetical protein [Paludibaculum fermentans]|uniref:Uncharacterized protein n=1 Tax=Paludibaculum fermentans TaxID=1473598 RepID=A0A7S7NUY1_PALFE|nr:hypothetical protein [Paludibaculum fermentans]QOY90267.1 hypothetical protein IRI77_10020 [Paludibaculum fermentans]